MEKQIVSINEYGDIRINIKDIMSSSNISRYALAKAINARFEVVDKWYKGTLEKIDTDILARICYVLECKPEDIIIYRPIEPSEKMKSK